MRALLLEGRGSGGAALRDVATPEPGPGQILVRMLAASVNRVDLYMRDSGAGITHTLPQIMGVDGVGEVASAPPGSSFCEGERVILYPYQFCGRCPHCLAGDQPLCLHARILGEHRDGTIAEYCAVNETSLLRLSTGVDPAEAAALGVAYLTAWRMVFGKAPFEPGQTVFVQGAGGGVSYAAAQLALMAGARVIVSTSGAAKLARCREAGFEAIDYSGDEVAKAVLQLTGGAGADLVIDNVGAATWAQSLRAVRRGGHVVTCGATTGGQADAELQRLFIRQITLHGSTLGDLGEFARLVDCYQAGRFAVAVDSRFTLENAQQALARLDAPDRLGKVLIDIADPS